MKRFTKKTLALVLALTLVVGLSTTAFAGQFDGKYWTTYFATNDDQGDWGFEGAECASFKQTANSFTADLVKIGWQGVWGGQVMKKIDVTKGKQYVISFKAASSKLDKYVYVKVGSDKALAYSFWIKIPAGKSTTVTKVFKAAASSKENLTFGIGGDYGDRTGEDTAVRYPLFQKEFKKPASALNNLEGKPGDSSSPTKITVSNFVFSKAPGKVSVKKAKALGKKKVKVTWGKQTGAKKYEVMVGSAKKTSTKTSITMKAKKKGKQKVKVRAVVGSYKAAWSKAKTVKVK